MKRLASCARKEDYRGVVLRVMVKAASRTLRGDGPVNNDEVRQMENPRNDSRESVVDRKRNHGPEESLVIGSHKPSCGEGDGHLKAAEHAPTARSVVPKRKATSSWVNWQSAVYVFVLCAACLVLAPLTKLWWIVPILGAFVPLARPVEESRRREEQGGRASQGVDRERRAHAHRCRHEDLAHY